ncbi:MAG TPA: RyR domain-containing protein [Pyrinomonadaceae bacterium]|nr:RyR domain-containing protein [Pyrinomonadaceae bacterium]
MFSLEQVARIAHEANAALCRSIGDDSQGPWEEAPDWQRESSISAVRFILDNPDAGPGASHERWMREKLDAGWRHGPVKDAGARTHPCLVPFEELPPEQQAKDYLLRAVVLSLDPFMRE